MIASGCPSSSYSLASFLALAVLLQAICGVFGGDAAKPASEQLVEQNEQEKRGGAWRSSGMLGKRSDLNDDDVTSLAEADLAESVDKRSWQTANGLWGKRSASKWSGASGLWGKRAAGWNSANGLWGKRAAASWSNANGLWGKRSAWNSAQGLWGKRAASPGWASAAGAWGKRSSQWNGAAGLWGKRAAWQQANGLWGKRSFIVDENQEY